MLLRARPMNSNRVRFLDARVEERQACYSHRRWPTGRTSTVRSLLASCCRQNRACETLRSICNAKTEWGRGEGAENCRDRVIWTRAASCLGDVWKEEGSFCFPPFPHDSCSLWHCCAPPKFALRQKASVMMRRRFVLHFNPISGLGHARFELESVIWNDAPLCPA